MESGDNLKVLCVQAYANVFVFHLEFFSFLQSNAMSDFDFYLPPHTTKIGRNTNIDWTTPSSKTKAINQLVGFTQYKIESGKQ